MRVTTHTVYDILTGRLISWSGYDYSGPVALCGGGKSQARNLTQQQMQQQANQGYQDRGLAQQAQAQADAKMAAQTGDLTKMQQTADMLTSTAPGKMDPYSEATYSSSMDDIANAMNQQRQMGFRAIGQSGFGSSPGAVASMMNTTNQNAGVAQTGAFRQALMDTLNNNLTGTNINAEIANAYGGQSGALQGRSNALNSLSEQESGQSVSDAAQRMQMGSTFGDVMSGIGAVAPIAAAPFTGGASLGFGALSRPGGGGAGPSGLPGTSGWPSNAAWNPNISRPGGFSGIKSGSGTGGYARTGVGSY